MLVGYFTIASFVLPVLGRPHFDWNSIKYVYAFGDSYSFVQGELGHANFSFIGDALSPAFTARQLLSNAIIPKNTSSEGSNWLESLTGCFKGRPSDCAVQLWDFAFAGADIDGTLLPLHHDFTIPLVNQVNQWATFASRFLPKPPSETLTTWWIGINDTGDTINNSTIADFTAFWEVELTSYFKAVRHAYNAGLTGAHLFINVPPEERSPAILGNATRAALMKNHIDLFNELLAKYINDFAATHASTAVLSFDANTWFNNVLDHPEQFGFANVTGYDDFIACTDIREVTQKIQGSVRVWNRAFSGTVCPSPRLPLCLSPSKWPLADSGHPTERVHELLAKAIKRYLIEASSK